MSQLSDVVSGTNYHAAFNITIAIVGLTICGLVVILLLHTLHLIGRRSPLYRKRDPVEGWSNRFYPANGILIIFLLILMWLLNVWSHTFSISSR